MPFVSNALRIEGYRRELVEILIEECAEVTKRATKLLRFGPAEIQPGQEFSNAQRLAHEIGDVCEMIERLSDIGLIQEGAIEYGIAQKKKQLAEFMQHKPEY